MFANIAEGISPLSTEHIATGIFAELLLHSPILGVPQPPPAVLERAGPSPTVNPTGLHHLSQAYGQAGAYTAE